MDKKIFTFNMGTNLKINGCTKRNLLPFKSKWKWKQEKEEKE